MLCIIAQLCLTLQIHQAPLSVGILQARILKWAAMPSSRGSFPIPGIKLEPPELQMDRLLSEPLGKPKGNTVIVLLMGEEIETKTA